MANSATAPIGGALPKAAAPAKGPTILGRNLRGLIVTIVNGMGLGFNIRVSFRGTRAFTNGREITLPAIRDLAEIPVAVSRALIGYAIHEVAHIRYTDFKQVTRSYQLGDLVQKFANAVEDYRIEGVLSKAFLGAGPDLTQLRIMIHPPESRMKKRAAWLADPRACGPLALTWTGSLLNGFRIPAVQPTLDMMPQPVRKLVDNWTLRMTGVADTTAVVDLAAQFAAEAEAYAAMTRGNAPQPKPAAAPETPEPEKGEGRPDADDAEKPTAEDGPEPEKADDDRAADEQSEPDGTQEQPDGDRSEGEEDKADGDPESEGESKPAGEGEDPTSLSAGGDTSEGADGAEGGDAAPGGGAEKPGDPDQNDAEGLGDSEGGDESAPSDALDQAGDQDEDQVPATAPAGDRSSDGNATGQDAEGSSEGEESPAGAPEAGADETGGAEDRGSPSPPEDAGPGDGAATGAGNPAPGGGDAPGTTGAPDPSGHGDSVTHDGPAPGDQDQAGEPDRTPGDQTGKRARDGSDGGGQPSAEASEGDAEEGDAEEGGQEEGEADPFGDALDPNAVIDDIMDDMMRGMARGKPLDEAAPDAEDGEVNPSQVLRSIAKANSSAPAYDSSDADHKPGTGDDGQPGDDAGDGKYSDSRFQEVQISQENALSQLRATASGAIANTARAVKRLLKSQDQRGVRRNMREGDLDMENTNSIVLGDGQCYKQTWTRNAPTTLVAVLGDFSSSMMRRMGERWEFDSNSKLIEPRDMNGNVLPSPLQLAVTGMLALEQATLGTSVETLLYGYTGWSPNVVLSVFKDGRASRVSTLRKLGSYQAVGMNCTPTGEAMAAVAARMDTIAADRRVMIVLTDGTADNATLCGDVARVLRGRGIELVAIGICHDAVTKWAPVSHVINDVADLPKALLATIDPRGLKKRRGAA